jgi:GTP-binding protein Era
MAKSAFVAIAGRPSAGKSTLVNALCGAKVSIVSPVPQTTRNTVRGIVHRERGQLVFLDTPGFHISDKKLNLRLRDLATHAFADADLVVYLLDCSRAPGDEEEALAKALASQAGGLVVALNKTDAAEANPGRARDFVARYFPKAPVVEISALRETGLDALLDLLFDKSPEGPAWYPAEYYTDQEPVFRIAEIVREKAILHTREELPHALYVDYQDSRKFEDGTLEAEYDLVVERDSQKGILIGKGGSMIKCIREEAEADLGLQIRVDPNWKRDEKRLGNLIF